MTVSGRSGAGRGALCTAIRLYVITHMCMCICICIYIYIYIYNSLHIYIYISLSLYIYIYIYTHTRIYIYIYVHMFKCNKHPRLTIASLERVPNSEYGSVYLFMTFINIYIYIYIYYGHL